MVEFIKIKEWNVWNFWLLVLFVKLDCLFKFIFVWELIIIECF